MIIELAKPKIKESQVGDLDVGAMKSDTRTSKNAWISRGLHVVTDTIYRRAADVLHLDEKLLNNDANSEQMQVYCTYSYGNCNSKRYCVNYRW
jgi:hypothetical protein